MLCQASSGTNTGASTKRPEGGTAAEILIPKETLCIELGEIVPPNVRIVVERQERYDGHRTGTEYLIAKCGGRLDHADGEAPVLHSERFVKNSLQPGAIVDEPFGVQDTFLKRRLCLFSDLLEKYLVVNQIGKYPEGQCCTISICPRYK